ncbi:hypothetical protein GP486_000795 [Trichoglossum hirsutum]|uniref:G-patch domain-containing protein n=1 Tax=Trichoglossum hirsutum TaxID=265104 RepID=A0A9P8RTP9_9PEZI|nr:hypothetical protein GP486_000795 [Trichoglossum hirsutum]
MDTAGYLKSQGWLGAGHTLTAGKGISKPLLVSRKLDVLGLGKKRHDYADQWWARAFDNSLEGLEVQQGNLGADGTREVTVTQKRKGGLLEGLAGGKGALYSMFVKGEGLDGTIGEEVKEEGSTREPKLEECTGSREEGKGDRRRRKKGKNSKSMDGRENSRASELKRERRRRRLEAKSSELSKRTDLSATSTSQLVDQRPEAGMETHEAADQHGRDELKPERKRKKKSKKRAKEGGG